MVKLIPVKTQADRQVYNSISSPKYSSFSLVIGRLTVMLLTQREWRGALAGNIAVSTRKKKRGGRCPSIS